MSLSFAAVEELARKVADSGGRLKAIDLDPTAWWMLAHDMIAMTAGLRVFGSGPVDSDTIAFHTAFGPITVRRVDPPKCGECRRPL